ncbi:DUF3857 domain-containing protein [Lutibacter sp.]|uniref:DUF3857 domain-containing protein n=1 Tax=Lutibacter sp. TaxID=1925666 RepID=UPI0025C5EB5C|nr:DUF3857 domain-containing protein [Lutibacter sp.]MCF6182796.1 DUF3857 and transglutaminase domain-containing protein [Lutibacter sp.]
MKKIILTIILLAVSQLVMSQNYKVGKVSKEELQEKAYPLDSSANAAYLYKKRKTYFKYVQKEGFKIITEVQERIKIYNHEGYNWATKVISYYNPPMKSEKVTISNAKTFTLKNGKIETFKLKKSAIFDEKENKYWSNKKFTMPNISDGCVIEWTYRITSPYRDIRNVELQSEIPIKKISCKIEIPEYYMYSIRETGFLDIPLQKVEKSSYIELQSKNRSTKNHVTGTSFSKDRINLFLNISTINKNNIPALLDEPFVDNINNYKSAIHYELATLKWPNEILKNYTQTWDDVAKTIARSSEFGGELKKTSYFKEDLIALRNKFSNKNELMLAIFEFVKHKVKWNNTYGKYSYKGVRYAYKKGEGSVADINLILVAMLRAANINANPIILSTRSHGVPIFPTLNRFNYVIACVETENNVVLFDATEENSTPNVLPLRDLNWKGRIIRENESSTWVNLIPKPADLNANTQITINEDGEMQGMKRTQYKNYEALKFRNKYRKVKDEDVIGKIEEDYGNIEISDFRIVNKNNIYKPVIVMYKFYSEEGVDIIGNKMYFSPLFFMAETKNPFKLEKRDYPIDFGMPNSNKKIVSIVIPSDYVVESIPKSFAIGLPDNLGVFKFSVTQVGNKINIISLLKINSSVISATYYAQLKEFFKQRIAKNTEKVVLIKA